MEWCDFKTERSFYIDDIAGVFASSVIGDYDKWIDFYIRGKMCRYFSYSKKPFFIGDGALLKAFSDEFRFIININEKVNTNNLSNILYLINHGDIISKPKIFIVEDRIYFSNNKHNIKNIEKIGNVFCRKVENEYEEIGSDVISRKISRGTRKLKIKSRYKFSDLI